MKEFSMKFKGLPCLLGLLILVCGAPCADAREGYHAWSVGLRGGPSILTQDSVSSANVEGQIGPLFNGLVLYDLHKYVSLGLEAEWERHKTDQGAVTLGDADTASIFFRAECHLQRTPPISPYFFLAGGYNINSFGEEDAYLETCEGDCRIKLDNGFGVKVGFGADLFVLFENAAINLEVAWKYNKADIDFISGGETVVSEDYNGSALSLLIGFRYYFPVGPFE
jgi:hypothetical protein